MFGLSIENIKDVYNVTTANVKKKSVVCNVLYILTDNNILIFQKIKESMRIQKKIE